MKDIGGVGGSRYSAPALVGAPTLVQSLNVAILRSRASV
jgi:hypothetical protein